MSDDLKIKEVKEISQGVLRVSTSISTFYVNLLDFSVNVSEDAKKIESTSAHMLEVTKEASDSMEQVNSIIGNFTTSVTGGIEELNSIFGQNETNVKELADITTEVESRSDDMDKAFNELMNVTEQIEKLMESIGTIANKTNLLALNASIEAARAGEAGRGFAVVANEVRNLSVSTKQNLEEINSLFDQLAEASTLSKKAIGDTVGSIGQMGTHIKELRSSFSTMSEVTGNMKRIGGEIQQIESESTEVGMSLEAIREESEGLYQLSVDLADDSKRINTFAKDAEKVEQDIGSLSKISGSLLSSEVYKQSNEEFIKAISNAITAHENWTKNIEKMADNLTIIPVQTDGRRCGFGYFYHAVNPSHPEIKKYWLEIEEKHLKLHKLGSQVIDAAKTKNAFKAKEGYREVKHLSQFIIEVLSKIENKARELDRKGETIF